MNAKLNGVNAVLRPANPQQPNPRAKPLILSDLNYPVLIAGADVTHPSPGDRLISSVAALVGSYDINHAQYATAINVQAEQLQDGSYSQKPVETILHFGEMFEQLLDAFHAKNQDRFPKHIILFRDGVSDSQFDVVRRHELGALFEVCKRKGYQNKPKVTFIVVQKRHQTRFRPLNSDRNITPGTIVDSHIVHPIDFDYYLCSHMGFHVRLKTRNINILYVIFCTVKQCLR